MPRTGLFSLLAVFAGGFDEPAAAAVSGEPDVLSNLRRLEAVSLLRVAGERDREPRFTLLETIRSVAAAALERAGADPAVRRRHADYFAAWAEDRVKSLRRSGDTRSRTAFETEVPNLYAAYAFAAEAGDAVVALSLATSIGVAGRRSPGSLREHIARLEHALGMGRVPPRLRCEGLNALAWLADDVSAESVDVDAVTTEALELASDIGPPLLLARTLIARATVAVPPDAVELLDQAATIAIDAALPFEAASAYNNAADLLGRQGHFEAARDSVSARSGSAPPVATGSACRSPSRTRARSTRILAGWTTGSTHSDARSRASRSHPRARTWHIPWASSRQPRRSPVDLRTRTATCSSARR